MSLLKRLEDQMVEIEREVSRLSWHLVDHPQDEAAAKQMQELITQHAGLVNQFIAAPSED